MWHAGLDEAQVGIMISGRNIHNLRYTDDTTPIAEREEELRRLLIKLEEEAEKAGFQLSLQKTKIMAPVISFHGKQWEKQGKQWVTLFLGVSKSLQMVIAAMKLKDAYSLEGMLWPT